MSTKCRQGRLQPRQHPAFEIREFKSSPSLTKSGIGAPRAPKTVEGPQGGPQGQRKPNETQESKSRRPESPDSHPVVVRTMDLISGKEMDDHPNQPDDHPEERIQEIQDKQEKEPSDDLDDRDDRDDFHAYMNNVDDVDDVEDKRRERHDRKEIPLGEDGRLEHNRQALGAIKTSHVISASKPIGLWFKKKLSAFGIQKRRQQIKQQALTETKGNANMALTTAILQTLMKGYNDLFFAGQFYTKLMEQKTNFTLVLVDANQDHHEFKKGWAGFCQMKGDQVTIALHPGLNDLIFESDPNSSSNPITKGEEINGILCTDRVECAQVVLEHELIHLIHQVFLRKVKAGHGKSFKDLAKGLFGHSLFTHAIGHGQGLNRVRREEDREAKFAQCKVGDLVVFCENGAGRRRFDQEGCIVVKGKEQVVLMSSNGSLLVKVPFADIKKVEEQPKRGLRNWTSRFLENKKNVTVGSEVTYERQAPKRVQKEGQKSVPNFNEVQGTVLAKKPLGAQVALDDSVSVFVPYHCLKVC